MATITVDGRWLEDYGLDVLRPLTGWNDFPVATLDLVGLVGVAGSHASTGGMLREPRTIDVRVRVKPATLAGRKAALGALYQGIGGRLVNLGFADDPTREIGAILVGATAAGPTAGAADLVDPDAVVSLRFVAPDPFYYDVALWNRAVPPTTQVEIPVGDAGAIAALYVSGVSAATTITIRSGLTGATLYTLTLTGTALTASQWLAVLLTEQRVRLITGSPYSDADAYARKGASDVWPRLDPFDDPTIEISSGDGLLIGKRAYQV